MIHQYERVPGRVMSLSHSGSLATSGTIPHPYSLRVWNGIFTAGDGHAKTSASGIGRSLVGLFQRPALKQSRTFFVHTDELDQVFDSEVGERLILDRADYDYRNYRWRLYWDVAGLPLRI
jgi:hypothetical protein